MRKFIGSLIFATLIASPAVAGKAVPMCEIWASTEAPNVRALLDHEEAHCWGWVHGNHAKPKPGDTSYRASPIPLKYRLLGHYPKDRLIIYYLSEKDAYAECGSWGCQSGGLQ